MSCNNWMIYGAYGYTGALVTEEAVRRGHRPVLAGRSTEKLIPLAKRLGLYSVVVDLQDEEKLSKRGWWCRSSDNGLRNSFWKP